MMLALLFMMVTLALASLLVATSLGQAKNVRHDQKFTQVLPAADAGIQRGLFILNNGGPSTLPVTTGTTPATTPITQGNQTANWTWSTQANVLAPPSYLLSATSTPTQRTVVAEAYQSKRFSLGAFADQSFVMRGGNTSGSYNSGNNTVTTTGVGRIGSNGSVTFSGNATADGVDLYDWSKKGNPSRCRGGPCPTYTTYPDPYDISSPTSYAFITAQLAACASPAAFTTSTAPSRALPAGTYCASSLNFDVDTTVTGPTVIYVSGAVTLSPHVNVNFTTGVAPVPSNLQIYSIGSLVDFSNHINIGAAVYAPLAACNGGAQAAIYGSIVCRSISNVGGWAFHYDEALSLIGAADFRLRHYREQ